MTMAWMSLSCASVMGGVVSRLCNRALPVMGRLRMSRVVSDSAARALPVLGCFLVSHKPRKASSIRLVGGRIRALRIFLSRNGMGGRVGWCKGHHTVGGVGQVDWSAFIKLRRF